VRCERHGVQLTVKRIDAFQRIDARPPHSDPGAVRRVFDSCWLKLRCHMAYRGRFYACTRPPHLAQRLDRVERMGLEDDGVSLEEPRLAARILEYLQREEPLAACRFCLGAGGDFTAHRQVRRRARAPGRRSGSEARDHA
jgi:hypothetical protein